MSNKLKNGGIVVIVIVFLAYILFKLFFTAEIESNLKPMVAQQEKDNKQSANQAVAINKSKQSANQAVAINKSKQSKNTPIPKLKIQIFDIVFGKTKDTGYALIAYNGAPQQVYIVGANLSEGVVLKSMSIGEVLIDNHGKQEKYSLQTSNKKDKQVTSSTVIKKGGNEAIQPSLLSGSDDTPQIDGSVPPLPAPREPVQPREYIPAPPSGGVLPE